MEISQVFLQYFITTILVILAGIIFGGGFGILLARLLWVLYNAAPSLRPPLMLIPWRTILFGLILFFFSPIAIFLIPSIFQKAGATVYPALVFTLVVMFFVADEALTQWMAAGSAVRWVGLARTFVVACGVGVAIGANATGSGILMVAQRTVISTFKPDAYWTAMGVVMGLGLVFDLLLGIVQMLMAQAADRKAAKLATQPKAVNPIGLSGD